MEEINIQEYLDKAGKLRKERRDLLEGLKASDKKLNKSWYSFFTDTTNKIMLSINKETQIWERLGDYVMKDDDEECGIPILDNIFGAAREAAIKDTQTQLSDLEEESDKILELIGTIISGFREAQNYYRELSPFRRFMLSFDGHIDSSILDIELPKEKKEGQ